MVVLHVLGLLPAQDRRVAHAARRVRHHHVAQWLVQTLHALGRLGPPLSPGHNGAAAGLVFLRCSEAKQGQERPGDQRAASGHGAQGAPVRGAAQRGPPGPPLYAGASRWGEPCFTPPQDFAGKLRGTPDSASFSRTLQQDASVVGSELRGGRSHDEAKAPLPS